MKRILITILIIILTLYLLVCGLLFSFQEKVIFFPRKLNKTFQFHFDQPFEEKNIKMADGTLLSGLLLKSQQLKGLIFYLHGNAGALDSWGDVASAYTAMGYDVFMLDYRGYGKSESTISSQKQLYADIQTSYNELLKAYDESKIVILGYSIGTGPAAKLASTNHPKLLILQAPYYNLTDMMRRRFPIIPTFTLKYKFETNRYLKDCKMPVVIFHGDVDEVIYYGSSLKLQKEFKQGDELITLKGQGHNGMSENATYLQEIERVLNSK